MLLQHVLTEQKIQHTSDQHQKLLDVFRKDSKVTHNDVKKLAKEFELDESTMQLKIYDMLGDLLRNIGKHNDVPDDKFDKKQLRLGIKEEMEHTKDPLVAKMIAKDHLSQDPDYYIKLLKMVEKK